MSKIPTWGSLREKDKTLINFIALSGDESAKVDEQEIEHLVHLGLVETFSPEGAVTNMVYAQLTDLVTQMVSASKSDLPKGYVYCPNCDGEGRVYHFGGWFMCRVCDGESIIPESKLG